MTAMSATMKQCPRCAEMVLAEATACRFCGYDPQTIASAKASDWDRQLTWFIIALVVAGLIAFVVLVAIGAL